MRCFGVSLSLVGELGRLLRNLWNPNRFSPFAFPVKVDGSLTRHCLTRLSVNPRFAPSEFRYDADPKHRSHEDLNNRSAADHKAYWGWRHNQSN